MSDYTSTFNEQDGVDDVNASDFSTEFSAIQTHIATKVNVGDDITGNAAGIIETGSSVVLNTVVLTIGDWNMDTTAIVNVAHGIADFTKIRTINVIIRNDADTEYQDLYRRNNTESGGEGYIANGTNIQLYRGTGGAFDNASHDSTSYNRGWVTVQYTD